MLPEHKVWAVISAITDAQGISPSGGLLRIVQSDLDEYINLEEARSIFQLLATEIKVIELVTEADESNGEAFEVRIPDEELFKNAYDNIHYKFFGSVEKLLGENFFAVMDVAQDIHEQLQMIKSNRIQIPAVRTVVRYQILMPFNAVNYHERYAGLRARALNYLTENGCVLNFEVHHGMFVWESYFTVDIDRMGFSKFFEHLLEVYPKKVQSSSKTEESDSSTEPSSSQQFYFDQGVLHRDGASGVEVFAENTLEHTVLIAAFKTDFGERIDNATHPIDCGWEKLYDTARRINSKVAKRFGARDFFKIDSKNKFIERSVK